MTPPSSDTEACRAYCVGAPLIISSPGSTMSQTRKAALALYLIALHPFNDGQKRTGFPMEN